MFAIHRTTLFATAAGFFALMAGAIGLFVLLDQRKSPAEASIDRDERPLHVDVVEVYPEDVTVVLSGYGVAGPLVESPVAPEVGGRVVFVHPEFVVGGVIEQGDILFEVDRRHYESRMLDARAAAEQLESVVRRLRTEWESEQRRLPALQRARDLAKADFDRAVETAKRGIGSQAESDRAERTYIDASIIVESHERELALYPMRIEEAERSVASAMQKVAQTELDLERTRVTSPFRGRVKDVTLAVEQFVTAGETVAVLADDSVLEILVPLDSRDARRWLDFGAHSASFEPGWFTDLAPAVCEIRWTEAPGEHAWPGRLHRVARFDEESRTLTVAVRVNARDWASNRNGSFPLVEGMFCRVDFPGHPMTGVYRLPPGTVSIDETIFTVFEGRLRTVPVTVERTRDDAIFVSDGLLPGDRVVLTRLVNPLENARCEIVSLKTAQALAD